jgi:hypothetical protein
MQQILKPVIAGASGAVLAAVVLFGGAAIAGTGVGAVFNLGQTNTVNAQSVLTGSSNAGLFKVANTGTGTGSVALNLQVPSGRAPFVTNGTGKVNNLQADTVDGQSANELTRVAGQDADILPFNEDGRSPLLTLTVTAPKPGFVVLSGNALPYYSSGGCALCLVHLRFHDVEANTDTVATAIDVPPTGTFKYAPLAITVTVPVAAGTHTFQLVGSWWDGGGAGTAPDFFYEKSATALYVRYNGVGTATLTKPAPTTPVSSPPTGTKLHD